MRTFTISVLLPSVTKLTPAPGSSQFGETITLPVTVTGNGPTPSGTVEVREGATLVGTGTLSGGNANLSINTAVPYLSVGTHTLSVNYLGDATYAPSSFTHLQTVNRAATTTVASSVSPTIYGAIATFTAKVSSVFGGAPSLGLVTFSDGGNFLVTGSFSSSTANSMTYTFTMLTPLAVGNHTITASYAATTSFAASTSAAITHVINPSPTTSSLGVLTSSSVFGVIVPLT